MILATVSDDRFGRKEGQYRTTQQQMEVLLRPLFGQMLMLTFEDIQETFFYHSNQTLLSNVDPARNGRAYKPYVIREALRMIPDGDFVVYSDCSPEMWEGVEIDSKHDLGVLAGLCEQNGGILSAFVKWDTRKIEGLGIHTHENFTTDRCINYMGLSEHRRHYMHASGMMVFQKTEKTTAFVDEWLHYNLIDECACLGKADVPNDYSYWDSHESSCKMGHRHDQSISGLLINKYGYQLVDIIHGSIHPYNFLNFCLTGEQYSFINPNQDSPVRPIRKGSRVRNNAGSELTVFEVWPENGAEKYVVGMHPESCYKTTADKLTLI